MIPAPLAILERICARRGLLFEIVDSFSAHLVRISCPRRGRSFYAGAGALPTYPGNDFVLGAAAKDKAFTSGLLKHFGFRVPQGDYFFVRPDFADQRPPGKEIDAAYRFVTAHFEHENASPLVIKPNSFSRARHVSLARNAEDARDDIASVARADLVCHLQNLIDDPEFRLFLVGGEVLFCYAKGRPAIIGDGRSSIRTLISRRAPDMMYDSRYLDVVMRTRGFSFETVLRSDEALPVHFIANLGTVGDFKGFVAISEEVRAWGRRLYDALPLKVMGIDVFSASGLADPSDFIVTDVNGSPALSTLEALGHRDVVEAAWERILDQFFMQAELIPR